MPTEEEFLAKYSLDKYEQPSVTSDIAVFRIRKENEESYRQDPTTHLCLLLVKRKDHPFQNHWALPGGFLRPNETIEECALREVKEETNVVPVSLMQFGLFSEPGRDPRGWIISTAFTSILSEDSVKAVGGDDALDAKWFDISFDMCEKGVYNLVLKHDEITLNAILKETRSRFGKTDFEIIDSGTLAFDHARIIGSALSLLRSDAKDFDIIFDFLPEKFTLTALQRVQETILNISILPANFRRKVSNYIEETDEFTSGAGHRPAQLFVRKK